MHACDQEICLFQLLLFAIAHGFSLSLAASELKLMGSTQLGNPGRFAKHCTLKSCGQAASWLGQVGHGRGGGGRGPIRSEQSYQAHLCDLKRAALGTKGQCEQCGITCTWCGGGGGVLRTSWGQRH